MRTCLLSGLAISLSISLAADRVTLTGKVTDSSGKPLEDATVMIYRADVKKGYSTFCPICYADCGKRAVTDAEGSFTIPKLDPDLRFELLVVHDGYRTKFVEKVDPSLGPAETAALVLRAPVHDSSRVVLGRAVDSNGRPLGDAVVIPREVATILESRGPVLMLYSDLQALKQVAVTNAKGEFELALRPRTSGVLVEVEAPGMAPKVIAIPTGTERKTISVSDGAVIRGRLMDHGKPMAGAEVGLSPRHHGGFRQDLKIYGDPYREIRISTQEDGSFVIPNVPAPVDWYIYGKMESIAALGATPLVECATKRDKMRWTWAISKSSPAITSAAKSHSAMARPWPRECG
jgi:Carboxypeptidase regulatory-like domain